MGMGSEPASIFHGEWGQEVLAAIRSGKRLPRGPFRWELPILCLLGGVSYNVGDLMKHCIYVQSGDDNIYEQVATICKKIQSHHVYRSEEIRRSKPPCF